MCVCDGLDIFFCDGFLYFCFFLYCISMDMDICLYRNRGDLGYWDIGFFVVLFGCFFGLGFVVFCSNSILWKWIEIYDKVAAI